MKNIEMGRLCRNEVCCCAANDVLRKDAPALPEMMQPPQAAIVLQGTHHLSAGQHHFPQGHHATQKTPAGADVFVWCIILYSFPHCLPVKNRRVVVARNTLPASSTVVGNSGCEGLQG